MLVSFQGPAEMPNPVGAVRRDLPGPPGISQPRWCTTMVIVTLFALLAVFSIISILMSSEDPRASVDTRDNPLLWSTLGRR